MLANHAKCGKVAEMKSNYGFSRRGPDILAEEIATVLSTKRSFEFKELFDVVHVNLKARSAVGGGEEMLRLRAYEKLQNMVSAGVAEKTNKRYQGVARGLADFFESAADMKVTARARNAQTRSAAVTLPA